MIYKTFNCLGCGNRIGRHHWKVILRRENDFFRIRLYISNADHQSEQQLVVRHCLIEGEHQICIDIDTGLKRHL